MREGDIFKFGDVRWLCLGVKGFLVLFGRILECVGFFLCKYIVDIGVKVCILLIALILVL